MLDLICIENRHSSLVMWQNDFVLASLRIPSTPPRSHMHRSTLGARFGRYQPRILKLLTIRVWLGVAIINFHATCGNGGIRPRPAVRIALPACRIDGGGDGRSIDRSWVNGGALVDMWWASAVMDSRSGILMVIDFWISGLLGVLRPNLRSLKNDTRHKHTNTLHTQPTKTYKSAPSNHLRTIASSHHTQY